MQILIFIWWNSAACNVNQWDLYNSITDTDINWSKHDAPLKILMIRFETKTWLMENQVKLSCFSKCSSGNMTAVILTFTWEKSVKIWHEMQQMKLDICAIRLKISDDRRHVGLISKFSDLKLHLESSPKHIEIYSDYAFCLIKDLIPPAAITSFEF